MSITKVEQWRRDRGYSYRDLAELLGCSRQYVDRLCKFGNEGSVKAIKILSLAQGELELEDLLTDEARNRLIAEGFIDGEVIEADEFLI